MADEGIQSRIERLVDEEHALLGAAEGEAPPDRHERLEDGVRHDDALRQGVNVFAGKLTNEGVAEAHGLEYTPLSSLIDGAGT